MDCKNPKINNETKNIKTKKEIKHSQEKIQEVGFMEKSIETFEMKQIHENAFDKNSNSNDIMEQENGEVGFILKMFEESKFIKSFFFSSLVGRKKDFLRLKNILGAKIEGIGEVLTGDISQGMNKRWIIGWRFNESFKL